MSQIRTKLPGIKPLATINYEDHLSGGTCNLQPEGPKGYNPLTRFCKQNELTKLNEDACYIDRRDHDSKKPFKWRTYHHHPYGCKVESTCYPGQYYWDGYGVSGCNIDEESRVNRHPGYQATNLNVHQELPTLPVNLPRVRGYYNADTESNLRSEANFNNKQCNNTTEKSCIPYTFQVFDHLCYNPQDPDHIDEATVFSKCFPNAKFWSRGGSDTRHDRQERYRNACDWKVKFMNPSLSYSNFGY